MECPKGPLSVLVSLRCNREGLAGGALSQAGFSFFALQLDFLGAFHVCKGVLVSLRCNVYKVHLEVLIASFSFFALQHGNVGDKPIAL